ncbi:MAG: DinB family protein [Sediminibacterium sp.]|nr:DinB family protein [Sediminibacterium sp.]
MKQYSVSTSLQLLERTPKTLHALLHGLSDEWLLQNEGPGTWSAFDVVSHLHFCESNNFSSRIQIILSDSGDKNFPYFDMSRQFELTKSKKMAQLLTEFGSVREQNLQALRDHPLSAADLDKTGMHPKLGPVTLRNVLSAWLAHDLSHTAQVLRVMAKQYEYEVGPFIEFLRILK